MRTFVMLKFPFLLLSFCLLARGTCVAQSGDSSTTGFTASLGIGTNTLGFGFDHAANNVAQGLTGFGISVPFCYRRGTTTYTLVITNQQSEFQLWEQAVVQMTEIGLMYGSIHIDQWTYWSYSGGVTFSDRGTRGGPNPNGGWFTPSYLTVNSYGGGFIGELQAGVTCFHYVSLGVSLFGSLNTLHPYLAGALVLKLGYL